VNKKYTHEYVQQCLFNKNIKLLSTAYASITKPLELQCYTCNYEWSANFHHLQRPETKCPKCSHNRKYTYEEVKTFFMGKDIKLLTNHYNHNKQILELECIICENKWKANFHNVKNGKTGCPKCSSKRGKEKLKYNINDVREFLLNINIKLLSDVYNSSRKSLELECLICQKQWQTSYDNIKNNNTRCPRCSIRTSNGQKELENFITSLGFDIKSNDRSQLDGLELDVFIEKLNIAFEYCGLYWHSEKHCGTKARYKHLEKLKLFLRMSGY
jgi:Zn finger protein HypA/HybF involved in hydrogenase expression